MFEDPSLPPGCSQADCDYCLRPGETLADRRREARRRRDRDDPDYPDDGPDMPDDDFEAAVNMREMYQAKLDARKGQ